VVLPVVVLPGGRDITAAGTVAGSNGIPFSFLPAVGGSTETNEWLKVRNKSIAF
jgi:acyl CoA:acetate/3-ketoacid CoA transferase alpha subunit